MAYSSHELVNSLQNTPWLSGAEQLFVCKLFLFNKGGGKQFDWAWWFPDLFKCPAGLAQQTDNSSPSIQAPVPDSQQWCGAFSRRAKSQGGNELCACAPAARAFSRRFTSFLLTWMLCFWGHCFSGESHLKVHTHFSPVIQSNLNRQTWRTHVQSHTSFQFSGVSVPLRRNQLM